jgi:1,4-alpha-glucan branching enzyme
MVAIMLLAPSPPLLFMGEEWGASEPFLYFCEFHDALASAVREGRRNEFRAFPMFQDEATRARIPDPNSAATFFASRLDWSALQEKSHAERLAFYQRLLRVRHREIIPRLANLSGRAATCERVRDNLFKMEWRLEDATLCLRANLSDAELEGAAMPEREALLFAQREGAEKAYRRGFAPPWSVVWSLDQNG